MFPGNPVWDLSRARVPNTILVYLSLIPLMLAVYRDRERYLTWFARRRPWMQYLITLTAPLGLAGLLHVLGWLAPLYIRSHPRD